METKSSKEKLIEKYFQQNHELPQRFLKYLDMEEPILYGVFDINDEQKFCENWVVCTKSRLWLFAEDIKSIDLRDIDEIREIKSLSVFTYLFLNKSDNSETKFLGKIQFTSRQKIVMGHLKYYIENKSEEFLKGLSINAKEIYQDSVLKSLMEAQNEGGNDKQSTLWRLLNYLSPYKRQLWIGGIGSIAATIMAMVPALLSGKIIDESIRPFQDGILEINEASTIAWIMVAGLGASYFMRQVFMWMRLKSMSILGELVAKDLRTELYGHMQKLGLDFFSKRHTGSLITRVSSDTDRLFDFIAFGVVEFSISVVMLTCLTGMLLYLDWRLGLIMTLPVPLFLYAIYSHGVHMTRIFTRAWRKWSNLTRVLSDTIPGIQVVKAFNQEEKEVSRFVEKNEVVTEDFNEIHKSWTKFWPTLMFTIHFCILITWVFATPRLLASNGDSNALSAGTFVSFLLYMTMFSAPIEVIGNISRMVNRALSSAFRVFEILDTQPTLKHKEDAITVSHLEGEIEFRDVFFSYDGVRQILKGVNFKIEPGEMIGLVGSSGGGKSTITKLINRFYDVNSGSVLIDGNDVRDLEVGAYRRQVGMVLQDPYLFHGSVFENIKYGNKNASKSEVVKAAKMAQAHDFIINLSYGYDTVIGERGHTLSGGERQRISIARAILSNPKILILDEATSAVDTETERKIQMALENLIEGRTVLAVAHRLSTLRKANRLFVIKNGNLVEEGTHQDLMMKNGEYAKLKSLQLDGHEMQEENYV